MRQFALSLLVPLALVCFFAVTISINIMGIYETAIDTILLCFCVDKDRKGEKKYMSPELERYIDDVSGKEK